MENSVYRVLLDIHTTRCQTMLDVSKGDNARTIIFTLTDGGNPYDIEDDCTAIFRAVKPDGTVLYNACEIADNSITYRLTSQTSAAEGIIECEVQLLDGNEYTITSPRFALRVAPTLYSDSEIESTDEYTELTEAIRAASNLDISVSKSGTVTTVTVTDADGTQTSCEVLDGEKGDPGEPTDTGWQGITLESEFTAVIAPEVRCIDKAVFLSGAVSAENISTGKLGTIPEGFIPDKETYLVAITNTGYCGIKIETDGDIIITSIAPLSSTISFSSVWAV